MAILAECPFCHKKQSVKNRLCGCGADLVKLKRSQKVKYWITYRLPGGKQRREAVGYSVEEARDAEGKRRSQKRENRIFDIKPDTKMTFNELMEWFLGLEKVKALAYYPTLKLNLKSFNSRFGEMVVSHIRPADLEDYQATRKKAGYSDSYIDHEVGAARTMIVKAFDNDLVGGDTLRAFRRVKKLLKRNSNARNRVLSLDEFRGIIDNSPLHAKAIIATAFYTGMRLGEILSLTWDKVDLKNRVIRLAASDTKDNEPRIIPICDELHAILGILPRNIRENHLFLYKGKPVRDIRASLRKACKKVGIHYGRFSKDGFVFHDLRHTFNTNMRRAGVPESVIMKITGHSTREMFDRYNTVDEEDMWAAVGRFQGYLKSVDQNVDQVPSEG